MGENSVFRKNITAYKSKVQWFTAASCIFTSLVLFVAKIRA